jgi:Protein of unknown function (DUF3558)
MADTVTDGRQRARHGDALTMSRGEPDGRTQKGNPVAITNAVLRRTMLAISVGALVAGCSAAPTTSAITPNATATATTASAAASTAGTGGTSDPCSMLTTDQVAAALGQPPAAGKPEPDFDAPECEWDPASGDNGNVTLDIGPWIGNPGVKPLRLGSPVAGIGDEAYNGGNTGLYVHKGSQGFRIWVFNVHTQSSRLDLEKQLAGILLSEM